MTTSDDISKMFDVEYDKLDSLINSITPKSELPISEIIELYYQIINMSSMVTMLKSQINSDESNVLFHKITETEKLVSQKFDLKIHPQIMKYLVNSISEITTHLQSINPKEKSKNNIVREAKLYEELRKKMSTREFVEQYDKGLSHD
jgi:hypothetical protein